MRGRSPPNRPHAAAADDDGPLFVSMSSFLCSVFCCLGRRPLQACWQMILFFLPSLCDPTMSLTDECRLMVLQNMILRRIFRPKRDENGDYS